MNSGGAAQQMADTQLDNLQGQLTILKSALEGLAIYFGQLLMPAMKNIVSWLQKFVDWLNSMDEGTKKVIMTIARRCCTWTGVNCSMNAIAFVVVSSLPNMEIKKGRGTLKRH